MEQRAGMADRLGAYWLVSAKCALFNCTQEDDYEKSWHYHG